MGAAGSLYDEPFHFGEQPLAASNNSKQLEVETKQPCSNNYSICIIRHSSSSNDSQLEF